MTLTTEDRTGWRIEDTTAQQRLYEKYLTEANHFDFTFREHGLRVHPLVVQVALSRHPEPSRFDLLLYMVMENLGGILNHTIRLTTCDARTADQVLLRIQIPP